LIEVNEKMHRVLSILAVLLATATSVRGVDGDGDGDGEILIENFARPTHSWDVMNDPVMGGKSTSSYVNEDGIAKFTGVCAIVSFLQAPGFVTLQTGRYGQGNTETFPDVSTCTALKVVMKSNVPYDGYRISFGAKRGKMRHGMGYKAPALTVPSEFDAVVLPFRDFSLHWDEGTGDILTSCSDDESVCPDLETLRDMKALAFWGEGVEGEVSLEIKSISAVGCGVDATKSDLEDVEGEAESANAEGEDIDTLVVKPDAQNHADPNRSPNEAKDNNAGIARWTLHTAKWGTLTTVSGGVLSGSGHSKNLDDAQPLFASVLPYATDEETGRIFFYLMGSHHLPESTLTVSQASINPNLFAFGGCGTSISSAVDAQDPRCAKISVSGAIHPCNAHDVAENCDSVGREALFVAHPAMEDWPKDHDFIVHELIPRDDGFWMLANFGGGSKITRDLYSSCEKEAIKPHAIQGGSIVVATPFAGNGSPKSMPVWSARAERARWIVHNSLWVSLSTLDKNGDGTFGNIRAITDGDTLGLSTGLPVFNLPDVDPAAINMRAHDMTIALTFTEASLHSRITSKGETCAAQDAGSPTCAQVVIYGKAKALDTGSEEYKKALKNFGVSHPLASWLSQGGSHMPGTYFTIQPTSISILDYFGGAVDVLVDEYLGVTFDDEPGNNAKHASTYTNIMLGLVIGILFGCFGNSCLKCLCYRRDRSDRIKDPRAEYGTLSTTTEVNCKEDKNGTNSELTSYATIM